MLWGDYNAIRYTMLSVNNNTHWYKNVRRSPLFGLYMGEPGNEATSTMKDVKTPLQDMQHSLLQVSEQLRIFCSLVMPIILIIFSVVHQEQNIEKDKLHSLNINDCYTVA